MRRSADDTKWLLYDVDNDRETWPSPSTMTVDIIEFIQFAHLSPLLQVYIYKAASHEFQKSAVSSQILWQFTKEDVEESEMNAVQEDAANEDRNMFRDSRSAFEVVYRYNPLYNT